MIMQNDIIAHVESESAREACGVVINDSVYMPCRNIAADPLNFFDIHPDDYIDAERRGEVTAIVHSHLDGLPHLSVGDRQVQLETGLDWWVVCDGVIYKYRPVAPLLGRQFEHGVFDCYTLFRDAYHLAGVNLDDFGRWPDWWESGRELYLENMRAQGFYQVDEPQAGDMILICLGSARANHSAIYTGDQYILHHCPNRLSKRDLYNGFWLKHTHSLWRHKQWLSSGWAGISADLEKITN